MTVPTALILAWLATHGYKDAQATAITTYIKVESEFNPCASSRLGHYLFQWVGERRARLEHWARLNRLRGCPPWQFQMAFMDQEVKEAPWNKAFHSARSPILATKIWRTYFGQGKAWGH